MPNGRATTQYANGLSAGQYLLPNFEFIFAENLSFGQPLVPNNLQDLPFLFCGSGPLDGPGTTSPIVGPLVPAPWAPPMDDPIFHSTLCPNAPAVGAQVFPAVSGAPDVITIQTAAWDNRTGKGKVNLAATSSASPAPAGMFMTATLVNDTLPPGVPGSTTNPITSGMILAPNTAVNLGVCPTDAPCWQLIATGLIVNPAGQNGNGIPTLVPPTLITLRSSLGGVASTDATTPIAIKNCVPKRRVSCL
jgi:hypothetical protein